FRRAHLSRCRTGGRHLRHPGQDLHFLLLRTLPCRPAGPWPHREAPAVADQHLRERPRQSERVMEGAGTMFKTKTILATLALVAGLAFGAAPQAAEGGAHIEKQS